MADTTSPMPEPTIEAWQILAREQSKIIERMATALRRIRDMEAFEFDQRQVAREALNDGE